MADDVRSDVRQLGGEALLAVCGAATSAITIGIVYLGRIYLEVDISSFSFWLVIPVGALMAGAAAASGYYFGALWLGRRPSRQLLINMVLVGLSSFAAIQYFVYETLALDDGTPVADLIGFWSYYKIAIENQSMSFSYRGLGNGASTGTLGGWGYLVEGIQLAAFLVGSFAAWAWLIDKPYCATCSRYFKSRSLALSSADNPGVDAYLADKGISLPGVGDDLIRAARGKPIQGARLKLETCPSCSHKQLAVFAVRENDEIRATEYDVSHIEAEW